MTCNIAINGFFGRMGQSIHAESMVHESANITLGCDIEEKVKTHQGLDGVILTSDITSSEKLFDVVIEDVSLQKEIKNLIIYKKALYNADDIGENELLKILNPIINSESVWKSHALYLIAEYFFHKGEKQKSIEFFNQIISLESANQELKIESQKRLNRDLSE